MNRTRAAACAALALTACATTSSRTLGYPVAHRADLVGLPSGALLYTKNVLERFSNRQKR